MAANTGIPGMARLWGNRRDGDVLTGWEALIRTAPDLAGAVCKGRAPEFDYDDATDPRAQAALDLCEQCPVRQACADWVSGLPEAQKPMGVVGGRIVGPLAERRKATRKRATQADIAALAGTLPTTPIRQERPRQSQTAATNHQKEGTA